MINNNSKDLIYYTVSGDIDYLNLLNISIESLITFGKYKGDILLICDRVIKDNITIDYPNLKFMIVDEVDKDLSSGNKLRIYEYENLSYYDNILFLDSDILIINDIYLVFKESKLIKDKFIVSSETGFIFHEKFITNNGYAGELLTEDQKLIYKDIPCISAGCFLFRNNKENIEILKEIYEMCSNGKRLDLYEQPYFNYVLLLKNKFIHNLQPYISHVALIDKEKVIIHYCGDDGGFQSKFKFKSMVYNSMKRDLEILKMNNFISYDIDTLNIWTEDSKFYIKSKIDIEDSKVVIYYNDVFVHKELVKFSKNTTFWFKPSRGLLEEDNICKVKVFDKYDNFINSIDLIVNFNFKASYNKDEDIIYISCDRNLKANVFVLRTDNSTIYKTETIFTGNKFWYKTDINLSSLYNIKIQIKKNNILLFEEVLSTNNMDRNNNSLCDIVVSKYKEDISWVKNITKSKLFIYDKSDDVIPGHIKLPNLGREAHTYLYHIINNYDNLSDYTCFLQGNPYDNEKGHLTLSIEKLESFSEDIEFYPLSYILECNLDGTPHHPNLDIDKIIFDRFFIDKPNTIQFTVGALFIVSKKSILSRKKELYIDILKEFDRIDIDIDNNGTKENKMPWVCERIWSYLFNSKFRTNYD